MRMHNYNDFIAFAFSYNGNTELSSINDISIALLIFSYPNSTDNNLYLNNYLKDYKSNNNNININLTKEVRIENNIFGYIFSGIEINDFYNCDNLYFYSNLTKNKIIENYNLSKNEIINIDITVNNKSNFDNFTCILKYRYKITEPELENYDKYTNYTETNFNSNYNETFEKKEYLGRLTYYNIILNETLTINCNDTNCALCFNLNKSYCIICKYNYTYFDDGTKNCSSNFDNIIIINDIEIIEKKLEENKEELVEIIPKFISEINIERNYQMIGNDFIITIKPTNLSIPNTTFIDFSSCENILRDYYNISETRNIYILQLEIKNKDDKSLINNVGYQAYDDDRNILNLSLCNNSNIQIFYFIKSNSSINISFISSFRDLNIDILNINDSFFNDICLAYSDSKNDVVLKDRISDIYQNYSLCDEGCTYKESNLELMIITCDCKIKGNLTTNTSMNFSQKDNVKNSSLFEIIKCYKLFLSMENKLNNIGFWIFVILLFLHIPLLFFYFYKGLTPIKNYLIKEMVEYGYIKKNNDLKVKNKQFSKQKSKKNKN